MNGLSLCVENEVLRTEKSARDSGKLKSLSIGEKIDPRLGEELARIAHLPYVDSVLALPDLHQKELMEIPSSIAVTTRDMIVPQFTSVAVNDGMGVVVTSLNVEQMSPEHIGQFFRQVNSHAAAHGFDMNRYSLTREELHHVLIEGGSAVIRKYGLPRNTLERMEWNGCIPAAREWEGSLTDVVPLPLLISKFSRAEMGLNFGGNHFLEVQVVDRILDQGVASQQGLKEGQVVVMYHLGPGPFGGTLLHHYSRRTKLRALRKPLLFLSKLLFHYLQRGRMGPAGGRKWDLHFKKNGWTPVLDKSEEGLLLRGALATAINFGFAYRLGTVKAIQEGLVEALSTNIDSELLADVPHNGIYEETMGSEKVWVARHNSCRLIPGKLTIVAGSYDVPSYLGIGEGPADDRIHSYDHGAGSLIEAYRSSGRLEYGRGTVTRYVMTRGKRSRVIKHEELPLRSAEPIDRLMECLEKNKIMRPVVRLRPIGNLKN